MATQFAENYYSFRHQKRKLSVVQSNEPDQAVLTEIEAKLVEASQKFYARQYQEAIVAYQEAESLIYAHLDPGFSGLATNKNLDLPRHPDLFDPLLSSAVEWLNILPVHQPVSPARPRTPVNPDLLGDATKINSTGLVSNQLISREAINALADLQAAKVYADQGNTNVAAFFSSQALTTNANVVNIFNPGGAVVTDPGTVTQPNPGDVANQIPNIGGVANQMHAVCNSFL